LNPHDLLRSQDFKSCASAISPHRQPAPIKQLRQTAKFLLGLAPQGVGGSHSALDRCHSHSRYKYRKVHDGRKQPIRSLRYKLAAWQQTDTVVAEGTISGADLARMTNGTGKFEVQVTQLGLYELKVEALDGQGQALAEAATTYAAVFPRTTVGPMDWGVCTHFAQGKGTLPRSLHLVKLSG
jgi:hypothetical protein